MLAILHLFRFSVSTILCKRHRLACATHNTDGSPLRKYKYSICKPSSTNLQDLLMILAPALAKATRGTEAKTRGPLTSGGAVPNLTGAVGTAKEATRIGEKKEASHQQQPSGPRRGGKEEKRRGRGV